VAGRSRSVDGAAGPAGLELPLVAWDGSPGAVKALELAVQFSRSSGGGLRLVLAGDEARDGVLDAAHRLLAGSGVTWESARLDLSPADAVAEAIVRWGADCVFMGAFGRGRLRDFLFGSHTTEIFEAVDVPVFVAP
jgi:nucleotide-binding universal stress UspA family protein